MIKFVGDLLSSPPGLLITLFLSCLLLAMAADAVRSGNRVYAGAVLGLAAYILGRMSEGFMEPSAAAVLKIGGLVLAALVLTFDLVTEVVEAPEGEPGPQV